ncbi:PAAR domain-containing protein [Burkholderia glumae]|uniref:PAAR domain-containing protein n=1 Tax=Burkholderia glumae TaxID=337 RepID=UPI001295F599|nr:PAAR domain-containing protein [Burkholderia glumae]QGA36719.1 PAAR domain-containing protein [Burkholderia glumae]
MSAFIREGDTTDHGGKVLACSPDHKVDDRSIARLGDMVSCPKCGGVYPIVQILPRGMSMGGKHPAFEGDKTACGASLIATQSSATAQPTGGAGGQAAGSGATASHESASGEAGPYRGRFQILDQATGQPIPNHPYTLHASDGSVLSGQTDENGHTQWHEAASPASLTFASPSTQVKGGAGDA